MTTLIETATKLLQTHGTPEKALKAFVQELKGRDNLLYEIALAYLQTCRPAAKTAPEPAAKPAPGRPAPKPAPEATARPAPEPAATTPEVMAKPAPEPAAKPTQEEGSVEVRNFEVPAYRRRTHQEKQAALAAAGRLADSVYEAVSIRGTALGELRWDEARTLVGERAVGAASHLREGKDATADAILLRKILNYATVTDTRTKIRDVVPAAKLREMIEESRIEAPVFIEKFMHRYAESLKSGEAPPQIEQTQE